MSKYKVVGRKIGPDGKEYEIREYGGWMRSRLVDGEVVTTYSEEPQTETERMLDDLMKRSWS